MDYKKLLAEEPIFWSRLGWVSNPVRLDENGKQVFVENDWEYSMKEHKDFYNKGVKIHSGIMSNGWVGIDKYDYTAVDKTLDAIFSIAPDVYYMPRIKLEPPIEWFKENPEELFLSYGVPRDKEVITALVDELTPYYVTDGVIGSYEAKNGIAGMQSFSSKKWIKDASVALTKVIEHIENGKYGDRVIAYHLAFGAAGETTTWECWHDISHWGDFGINNVKGFYNYCIKKYKTNEKIAEVYGLDKVDENTCLIPAPSVRKHTPTSLEDFFRVGNAASIDYSLYTSKCTVDAIIEFCKVSKAVSPNKPVGSFYGYITNQCPAESGHIDAERLIESDAIDFLSSPKGYYKCNAGGAGGSQSTSMAFGRKKMWIDELDNVTYCAKNNWTELNPAKTMAETRTNMWREVAKNLAWGNLNFWWMDLCGGWFLSEDVMEEVGKVFKFNESMRKLDRKSISEILLILDDKSYAYMNVEDNFGGNSTGGVIVDTSSELRMCGAPVDEYRLGDIKDIDLSQYKMIVFANALMVDQKTRDAIKSKVSPNTICIWNYAAGIRNPEYSLDNVKDLTGLSILPYTLDFKYSNGYGAEIKLPPIQIIEENGVEVIDRYTDGKVKTARKNNNILVASPCFKAEDFHKYAKEAGCHMFAPANNTVYADNRFIGIFPAITQNGKLDFIFDNKYNEVIFGSSVEGKSVDFTFNAKDCMIFVKN